LEIKMIKSKKKIEAQGLLDGLFLDQKTIEKIKKIITSVDVNKIKTILDAIDCDKEGWIQLKIDLRIKK